MRQATDIERIKASLRRVREELRRRIREGALALPTRIWGTITHVATDEPMAALTFDDGPHPSYTPALLDLLEEYDARCTFFVIGEQARRYPEIVDRIIGAGHAIGNHSWDHPSFPFISRSRRRAQIRACEAEIGPASTRLFRPPYGNQTFASRFDAWLHRMRVVTWSVVGKDWRDDSAEVIYSRLIEGLRPGSILLLHDALHTAERADYANREPMLGAVRMLLQNSNDYRFVTVPELLSRGRAQKTWWDEPGDADYLETLHKLGT